MRILLIGGTGAMGDHLANLLSDTGHNVVVTSRSSHENKESIIYRQGNAKNLDFLSDVISEGWDTIVDFMIYSEGEFNARVDSLLNSTDHYIFLSSARVYNDSKNAITEETPRLLDTTTDYEYLDTNEYALIKARQENVLYLSSKRNWTIIRPYITFGERRLQLGTLEKENWLYRALRGRTIVFSKDISDKLTTLTYGFDVATGIVSLINNPKSYSQIYNITSRNEHKWGEILEMYLDIIENKIGKRPKVILQELKDFQTWNPGKYQIIYDRLYDRTFDNSKISEFVDTKAFVKTQSGLKKCLEDFMEKPEFGYIDWKLEAIKDRFANERTPFIEIKGVKQKVKYCIYRYLDDSIISKTFMKRR